MWNQLFGTGLKLLARYPRYQGWTNEELTPVLQRWIVGYDYPDRPAPHKDALDLISQYAAGLTNSEARGPTPSAMHRATQFALRDSVVEGVLQRFQTAELAQGYLCYLDYGGQFVVDTNQNTKYRNELQQIAHRDWTGLDKRYSHS